MMTTLQAKCLHFSRLPAYAYNAAVTSRALALSTFSSQRHEAGRERVGEHAS